MQSVSHCLAIASTMQAPIIIALLLFVRIASSANFVFVLQRQGNPFHDRMTRRTKEGVMRQLKEEEDEVQFVIPEDKDLGFGWWTHTAIMPGLSRVIAWANIFQS